MFPIIYGDSLTVYDKQIPNITKLLQIKRYSKFNTLLTPVYVNVYNIYIYCLTYAI